MELKYFGTDGIRGKALEPPLSIENVFRWGAAWASVANANGVRQLVMGWDGRTSCTELLKVFLSGFGTEIETMPLGIVPTPAVAWITPRLADAWGLVVSASHNPPEDNGIKGFDSSGAKLPEEVEFAIESAFERAPSPHTVSQFAAEIAAQPAAVEDYISHLTEIHVPHSFPVVIDCAHGAAAPWAPLLFRGAVNWIGVPVDGERINVGVGSTHLDTLRKEVLDTKAAAGIAFDGDADRCLFLDGKGDIIDGDQMLWLLTSDRAGRGDVPPGVVGTIMSNGGLEQSLKEIGVQFIRTPVGDKHMQRELDKRGLDLAAESSGHIVMRRVGPSGDGLATALAVLRIIMGRPRSDTWGWRFAPWPQKTANLKAPRKKDLKQCPTLQEIIAEVSGGQNPSIRLVIRWSGTEPLLRIMAEAKEEWQVDSVMDRLVAAAKSDLLT